MPRGSPRVKEFGGLGGGQGGRGAPPGVGAGSTSFRRTRSTSRTGSPILDTNYVLVKSKDGKRPPMREGAVRKASSELTAKLNEDAKADPNKDSWLGTTFGPFLCCSYGTEELTCRREADDQEKEEEEEEDPYPEVGVTSPSGSPVAQCRDMSPHDFEPHPDLHDEHADFHGNTMSAFRGK